MAFIRNAMTKRELAHQAESAARWRGHRLGNWQNVSETSAIAECQDCGRQVAIDTNPPANGIDIGGEVVALNCGNAS